MCYQTNVRHLFILSTSYKLFVPKISNIRTVFHVTLVATSGVNASLAAKAAKAAKIIVHGINPSRVIVSDRTSDVDHSADRRVTVVRV